MIKKVDVQKDIKALDNSKVLSIKGNIKNDI